MEIKTKNLVAEVKTADSDEAVSHFQSKFTYETDCWDVHSTQDFAERGFVLLDVRSAEGFEAGHLPGAINLQHGQFNKQRLAEYATDTLFVVYCAGPHCNGSTRAALRLAKLGRPVKEMIGGITGWIDEGFHLVRS